MVIATKDLQELAFVAEHLPEVCIDNDLRGRLRRDPVRPEQDSDRNGRNAQFEAFLGAIAHRAGLNPRKPNASHGKRIPDWSISGALSSMSIECKRVGAAHDGGAIPRERILTAIADASEQIASYGVVGAIAVDVDPSTNPLNEPTRVSSTESLDLALRLTKDGFSPLGETIVLATRDKPVVRVMLHCSAVVRVDSDTPGRWGLISCWNVFDTSLSLSGQAASHHELVGLLMSALPQQTDADLEP